MLIMSGVESVLNVLSTIREDARDSAHLCQVIFYWGPCDYSQAPFSKIRGHVGIVSENTHDKFSVRDFNRFGAIST